MKIGIALAGNTTLNLRSVNVDLWIAIDGGLSLLNEFKIKPEILIGDMDSVNTMSLTKDIKIKKLNPIKDETDFSVGLKYVNKKYNNPEIIVVGFVSDNRYEHFYSNLNMLKTNMTFLDSNTVIKLLAPGSHKIRSSKKYFSIFAKDDITGLTYIGAKYPLDNYNLEKSNMLGISNEIVDETLYINFNSGLAYLFLSEEK